MLQRTQVPTVIVVMVMTHKGTVCVDVGSGTPHGRRTGGGVTTGACYRCSPTLDRPHSPVQEGTWEQGRGGMVHGFTPTSPSNNAGLPGRIL